MAIKQKIIKIPNDRSMSAVANKITLDKMLKEGWVIKSSSTSGRGYSVAKTAILGAAFLPLALLGKKSDVTEYILEKED